MNFDANDFIQHIRKESSPIDPIPTSLQPQLTSLPEIRAVCFDIYGTLLISASGDIGLTLTRDRTPALAAALQRAGFILNDSGRGLAEAFYAELAQHSEARRKEGFAFPEVRIEEVWQDFVSGLRARGGLSREGNLPAAMILYECTVNPVWPTPGMAELLRQLAQRGFPLGIISNAQFFTPLLFPALLDKTLPELGFSPSLCLYSFQERIGKPDQSLFSLFADRLAEHSGLQPHNCLYIGNDMRNDIAPAAACGFRTALFAGDDRSLRLREGDSLVGQTQPDAVLTALHQLPDLLALPNP